MIQIREEFTAKPGQASKLAKMFREAFGKDTKIMTDMTGPYNTVVMEWEVESLAEFEEEMKSYGKGEKSKNAPDSSKMKGYTDMYMKGKREIFRIWE